MGGGGSRRYDWETKVAAARDHVENGLTKTEAMARHGIASIASLERWCRDYRSGGPEALRPKPKGRPKGAKSKPKPEPTREQELAEQVAYLKAKVAYLEKLRALRASKSRGASEAPSSDCSQGGDTGSTTSCCRNPRTTTTCRARRTCPGRTWSRWYGRYGMAVPAPMVAGRARTPRHPPVHEPQGQLPGQRGGRAGLRPLEGRVLPRPCVRLVRTVQTRAGRLHHPLEHQTTPDTTRGTHPGGVPEHVPRGLTLYPN